MICTRIGTSHSIVENRIRPSALTRLENPVEKIAPARMAAAYSPAIARVLPTAPSNRNRGSSATRPTTVTATAVPQNATNALPAARAAERGSFAPRLRDTSEAPPTPTVIDIAPSTSSTGATRLTAAMASDPTPRATNHALVSA